MTNGAEHNRTPSGSDPAAGGPDLASGDVGQVPASTGGEVDLDRILGRIPVILVFLDDPGHPAGRELLRSVGEHLVDFGHDRIQVLAVAPTDQTDLVDIELGSTGNARVLADPDRSLAERFGAGYHAGRPETVLIGADGEVVTRWSDQADGTFAEALLSRLAHLGG